MFNDNYNLFIVSEILFNRVNNTLTLMRFLLLFYILKCVKIIKNNSNNHFKVFVKREMHLFEFLF